jgi:hypothetical protein
MKLTKANIMQVPTTITLNNGNSSQHLGQRSHSNNYYVENATFAMEMPDKLTSWFLTIFLLYFYIYLRLILILFSKFKF